MVHINDEEQSDIMLNIAPTQEDGQYGGERPWEQQGATGMMIFTPRSSVSTLRGFCSTSSLGRSVLQSLPEPASHDKVEILQSKLPKQRGLFDEVIIPIFPPLFHWEVLVLMRTRH